MIMPTLRRRNRFNYENEFNYYAVLRTKSYLLFYVKKLKLTTERDYELNLKGKLLY